MKIARAVLADGQALVGLSLSPSDIPNVKQRLGIGTPLAQATANEIIELVCSGALVELDNGWQLKSARIAGDDVIELSLCGVPANREELRQYGFAEEIIRFKRRWFVTIDNAEQVISGLLANRKAVKDLTVLREPVQMRNRRWTSTAGACAGFDPATRRRLKQAP